MFGPYEDNPEKADRLHAARVAAGFKSGRAAALAHGWNEATLRAHETATGFIDEAMIKVYAAAFKVDPQWLERGTGEGPPVDPVRQARFRARIENDGDKARKAAKEAGKRLRLARRVAGYGSVFAAAEALDLNRSTLNAHEVGQNSISPDVARFYAAALFDGLADERNAPVRPAGRRRGGSRCLLDLHDRRESAVRDTFAKFREGPPEPPPTAKLEDHIRSRSSTSAPSQVSVPEVAAVELYRATKAGKDPRSGAGRIFSFPADYLSEELNCGAETSVIVATGPDRSGRSVRIVIDRAFKTPNEADSYAVVRADGLVDIVTGEAAKEPIPGWRVHWLIVGKVCAVLERYNPKNFPSDHSSRFED